MNSPQKISVVIPVLNEEKALPSLLSALASQTLQPNEILFIDAGSKDQSKKIIHSWNMLSLTEANVILIDNLNGMPGANRNVGVQNTASGNWIAFLDSGITPNENWLLSLVQTAESTKVKAVFGRCKFQAYSAFQMAVCALSYGCTSKPVLPNSLFHPDIFKETEVGLFREDLRAAEDSLWLSKLNIKKLHKTSTTNIVSEYTYFPENITELFEKWASYELHVNFAGIPRKKVDAIIIYFIISAGLVLINFYITIALLFFYVLSRGVINPAIRSKRAIWWGKYPSSFLHALYLGPAIDLAICKSRIDFLFKKHKQI